MGWISDIINVKNEVLKDLGKKAAYWFIGSMVAVGTVTAYITKQEAKKTHQSVDRLISEVGKIEYLYHEVQRVRQCQDSLATYVRNGYDVGMQHYRTIALQLNALQREIDLLASQDKTGVLMEELELIRKNHEDLMIKLGIVMDIKKKENSTGIQLGTP